MDFLIILTNILNVLNNKLLIILLKNDCFLQKIKLKILVIFYTLAYGSKLKIAVEMILVFKKSSFINFSSINV